MSEIIIELLDIDAGLKMSILKDVRKFLRETNYIIHTSSTFIKEVKPYE